MPLVNSPTLTPQKLAANRANTQYILGTKPTVWRLGGVVDAVTNLSERTWNVIDNKSLLFLEFTETWNVDENTGLTRINLEC